MRNECLVVPLPRQISIAPVLPGELPRIITKMPVDERRYIPVRTYGRAFHSVAPTFEGAENAAVLLSLDGPFGFMMPPGEEDYSGVYWHSQQTNNLLIAPHERPRAWNITTETEDPLTPHDKRLLRWGVAQLALIAFLKKRQVNASFSPFASRLLTLWGEEG